jgi:hypothetical protein
VLAPMEASGEEGRRAREGRLRCGMLRGWRCPFIGPGRGVSGRWRRGNGQRGGWLQWLSKSAHHGGLRRDLKRGGVMVG